MNISTEKVEIDEYIYIYVQKEGKAWGLIGKPSLAQTKANSNL
jgi:hypothetical protein